MTLTLTQQQCIKKQQKGLPIFQLVQILALQKSNMKLAHLRINKEIKKNKEQWQPIGRSIAFQFEDSNTCMILIFKLPM